MAKKEMKNLMVVLLTLISSVALAQQQLEYKVLFSNSDKITIGNRKIKIGLLFDENDEIFLPADSCAMEVRDLRDGTTERIIGKKFRQCKTKTLISYFYEVKRLSTGLGGNEPNIFDTVYYMLNDVKIPAPSQHSSGIEYRGIVYMGKEHKAITVSRSKDSMEYVISRDVLGEQDKKPFYLDIIEKDVEKDWEYAVWHKLYVVPLPLKIE